MSLSVVIPVYNEEAGLAQLFARLYPALDALKVPYEVIFVNDGSRDRSAALLREQFQKRPEVTRVVLLNESLVNLMTPAIDAPVSRSTAAASRKSAIVCAPSVPRNVLVT